MRKGGEALMRKVMAAFAQSDLRPLLDALHEDVVWKSASKQEGLFSFHGAYKNPSGVKQLLSFLSKDYTFRRMEPKEILSVGDVVWGYFDAEVCYDAKGTGAEPKTIELDMAIRWRLKDGKIIEHRAFFDTAYLMAEQSKP